MLHRKKTKSEMFENVVVGKAMSEQVGSDSYGYWIAEADETTGIVGLYRPESRFTKCWQDGSMTAEPFDPKQKANLYYIAYRGNWYAYDKATKARSCYKTRLYVTDVPRCYRDPSF